MQTQTRDAINAVKDFIRNPYAWPGGYPRFLLMADGACLCKDCARSEYKQILYATRNGYRDGWGASGVDINWEAEQAYCAHCSGRIGSAYGADNE